MPSAPLPEDEAERLDSLLRMKVLDTPAEDRFDRLTRLARRHFQAPYSMITLLDEQRQWFKSACGHRLIETPREISFCGYTILEDRALVVEDASADERFFDNPVVRGEMGIRFYAGMPLHNEEGHKVGTFCLLDTKPRRLSWEEMNSFRDLAACAESELQLLRLTASEQELLQEMDDLRRKACVDTLTRCWNADTTLELLGRETARNKLPVAVLLVAVDHFTELNQSLGFEKANEVLASTAERLRAAVHPADVVGRGPGAQFVIICPGLTPARALPFAEEIRQQLSGYPVAGNRITASVGLALARGTQETPDQLLDRGRKALTRAQSSGPNRVEVAL